MKWIDTALFVLALGILATGARAQCEDLFLYPQRGQTKEQQQKDEDECWNRARDETSYDPGRSGGLQAAADEQQKRRDFRRAFSGCLEGRGYTVK